jgi:ABC-type transport system involved in multi-copper enzyme maturation permease subunit
MNPLSEISIVVARELRKNLRSAKGIILLALSLLGGVVVTLGALKLEELKRTKLHDMSGEAIRALREEALTQIYGDAVTGKYLADAPEVLLALLSLTVWLGPLMIALLGFDAVSGDIQHRTVRYWTVRTRRWSYFVGKFLGLWVVVSGITLGMHLVIWIVCIARNEASAAETLAWGIRFWLVTLPISAAWCGLATLIGSLFRTPILALLVIFASFFALWVVYVIGNVSGATPVMYIYPNFYDVWLLSARFDKALGGFAICAAFAAATMGLGAVLFARRDV